MQCICEVKGVQEVSGTGRGVTVDLKPTVNGVVPARPAGLVKISVRRRNGAQKYRWSCSHKVDEIPEDPGKTKLYHKTKHDKNYRYEYY